MILRPSRSTRTDTLFPYTTLFRSGLQSYQEVLAQESAVDPDSQISRQVREIAQRLIAKVPEVEDALAAENGMQAQHIEDSFDWAVTVLQSDQANAFCLPGGKMAVYTGLVPVAQNADAMAIVMGHEITHRSEEHTSEIQSLMRLSYAVFCVKKKKIIHKRSQ